MIHVEAETSTALVYSKPHVIRPIIRLLVKREIPNQVGSSATGTGALMGGTTGPVQKELLRRWSTSQIAGGGGGGLGIG